MAHGNGNGRSEPQPNRQAPLKERGQLPPPIVRHPIYECARAVHVSGCIPHALVVVYANGVEVVGHKRPWVSFDDIDLTRPLVVTDIMTATQEVFGITSIQSYVPVPVDHQPGSLGKPAVGPVIYDCGRVVPVSGLTPSTRVEVYQAKTSPVAMVPGNQIGTAECTGAGVAVGTAALKKGWFVAARQVSCPGTAHEVVSAPSESLKVPPAPHPMKAPTHDPYIPGNDVATLHGLYVGAEFTVTDVTVHADVLDCLANAESNWCGVQPRFDATHDYSSRQKLCVASPAGPIDKPTGKISTPALLSPICPGDRTLWVVGTDLNAALALYRVGSSVPIGFGGAAPGEAPVQVGPGYSLTVGDELYVRQYIGGTIGPPSNQVRLVDCRNVVTQHNDNRRTGAYLHETALTPASVSGPGFGRLFEREVDGAPYAQILYVRGVPRRGNRTTRNLFIVATSTNMVYAFDADDHTIGPSAGLAWQAGPLGPTRPLNANEICRETHGTVGITSTPVIDVASQTIYVVARHWPGSTTPTVMPGARLDGDYYLHALKLSDGSPRTAARKIQGHDPVSNLDFQSSCQRNRPGLLLLNGIVYVGFATFSCDGGPYRGWVLGYRADNLQPAAIFCTSKDIRGSGIWQSGNGLVGTDDGSIYFETGNDLNDVSTKPNQAPAPPPLADSFVRLGILPKWPGLQEVAHFQPANAKRLRDGDRDTNGDPIGGRWGDTDLGSGGPMRLPGLRLIGGGKQGRYYVLDASSMQLTQDTTSPDLAKIGQGFQAFVNQDRSVAADQATNFEIYGGAEGFGPNIHGGPCFWPGPSFIYQMPEKDYLKAFFYDQLAGQVQPTPVRTATVRPGPGMPGGHSSLSANGDHDGIVWVSVPTNDGQWVPTPGSLHAFDGLTLRELWADLLPEWFAKFNPPTIADGKVFRPVFPRFVLPNPDDGRALTPSRPGKVIVYGLLTRGHQGAPQPAPWHWRRWPGGGDPEPLLSMEEKWMRHGGSGALAEPQGKEVTLRDKRHGRRRDYAGAVGSLRGRVSVPHTLADNASCHRATTDSIPVAASVYWSRDTGAHAVLGEIRVEYLRQGGHASSLGYPVSDERDTADGRGRVSYFEGGSIVWFPDSGVETRLNTF